MRPPLAAFQSASALQIASRDGSRCAHRRAAAPSDERSTDGSGRARVGGGGSGPRESRRRDFAVDIIGVSCILRLSLVNRPTHTPEYTLRNVGKLYRARIIVARRSNRQRNARGLGPDPTPSLARARGIADGPRRKLVSERQRIAMRIDVELQAQCRTEAACRHELGRAADLLLRGRAYRRLGFVRLRDYARE